MSASKWRLYAGKGKIAPVLVSVLLTAPGSLAVEPATSGGLSGAMSAALPASPVQSLLAQGVFPPNIRPGAPVTRAQWATILIRALQYDTSLVSEFPVYRDVPRNYWAYESIESARNRELITDASGDGFYRPEQPIIYADVYRSIAKAITGPPPSPRRAAELLSGFSDQETLPEELRPSIAALSGTQFFWSREQQLLRPPWGAIVTPEGVAPLVISLMYLAGAETGEAPFPALPANLTLRVSPVNAVFRTGLSEDQGILFSLMAPAGPLPTGTQINGIVRTVEARTARVELTEAVTPAGSRYRTHAEVTLTFPARTRSAIIVPGTEFQAVTSAFEGVPPIAVPFEPSPGGKEPTAPAVRPALPPWSRLRSPPRLKNPCRR